MILLDYITALLTIRDEELGIRDFFTSYLITCFRATITKLKFFLLRNGEKIFFTPNCLYKTQVCFSVFAAGNQFKTSVISFKFFAA